MDVLLSAFPAARARSLATTRSLIAGVFMQAEAETSPVSAALRGRGLEHPATVAQINANNL
jgi:hypothetical protein